MGGSFVCQAGRFLGVLLIVTTVRSVESQQDIQAWKKPNTQALTRLIVKYKDGLVSAQSAEASVNKIQTHISFKSQRKLLTKNAYVIEAKDAAGANLLKHFIKQQDSGQIEYVEYDLPVSAFVMPSECSTTTADCTDTSSPAGKYWHQKNIKVDHVWNKMSFGGTSVLGGIIDTGIEWDHPELSGVVDISSSTSCMGPGSGTCSTTSPTANGKDDESHGTHCAGIMAAAHNSGAGTPIGVASSAKIISCKFLDSSGSGYISGAADCIYYLISKGVRVMSNSWGGDGTSQTLTNAVQAACNANALFLAAAGNENVNVNAGTDGSGSYPANYAGAFNCVITVAATDWSNQLTWFSNFGPNVTIAAPGRSIYSTVRAVDGSYAYYSGTSMATPVVAGAALALWNTYPTLSMKQVKDVIVNSATITATPYYANGGIGGKILDVEAAVAAAQLLISGTSSVDCEGGYTSWGSCSVSCGAGTQNRTFIITTPASNGGQPCLVANGTVQTQPCNMGECNSDCVGNFTAWSPCDKSCGGGSQSRTYYVTTPATGFGASCQYENGYTETQACNTQACTTGGNCTGAFSDWTTCSVLCGGGTQNRSYIVTNPGSEGGTSCPYGDGYTETQPCNTAPCAVIDCVGNYTSWGPCSKSCGGGVQNRMFLVTTPAANGGKDCPASNGTVESQACNTQACPPPAQSCRRDSQCSSFLRNMQLPAGGSVDCYTTSCSGGYCKLNTKYAGSRCKGGFCDGSGSCKVCLPQYPLTCPKTSPVCWAPANGTNQCGCSGDSDCPASTPICMNGKQCVQCVDNSGCTSQSVKTVCNTQTNTCVQCLTNDDCSSNPSTPLCSGATGTCVQCLSNTDCTNNTNGAVCNTMSKTCGCSRNSDCPSLPSTLPLGFDAQCLVPACTSFWAGTCSSAASPNKACIVAGSNSVANNGYCLVTSRRGTATSATCVACKSTGTSCSVNGECCSGSCKGSRGRRCA